MIRTTVYDRGTQRPNLESFQTSHKIQNGFLYAKIVGKLIEKNPNILDEWKGYPDILSFTFSIKVSKLYLLLWTDILQKTAIGCPCLEASRNAFHYAYQYKL